MVRPILCLLLLLLPAIVRADAMATFEQGMVHFRAGDYAAAASRFEQARSEGLDTGSTNYNLGVAYYKQGKYLQARDAFERTLRFDDIREVARYSLALTAWQLNEPERAKSLFREIASGKDPKLARMAREQLERIASEEGEPRWSHYVSVLFGHNDNIGFAPLGAATDLSDNYWELYASTRATLSGSGNEALYVNGSISALNYLKEDDFNETQFHLDIEKSRPIGNWDGSLAAGYDYLSYSGSPYQQMFGLSARGERQYGRNDKLLLRYRYHHFANLDEIYDYLDGWRQQLSGEYQHATKESFSRLSYTLELNDRRDTDSLSYSPTRHALHAAYKLRLPDNFMVGADLGYRYSDYPETPFQDRRDNRYRVGGEVIYEINKQWRLRGRYQYTNNASTDDLYDYKQHKVFIATDIAF